MVYSEQELIIPALELMEEKHTGIKTSILIKELIKKLKPKGHDAEIIPGRNDTYFSQKIRNLKSHDTLTDKGLAKYNKGIWKITKNGKNYLNEKVPLSESLIKQGFSKNTIRQESEKDYSGIIIEEGTLRRTTVNQRKRSNKLRNIVVKLHKHKHNGKLPCLVCGFDFKKMYGRYGKDFIEIHHTVPIHEMDVSGSKNKLIKLLKKSVPLCSNCHKMIHRKKVMLSIKKLKSITKGKKWGIKKK